MTNIETGVDKLVQLIKAKKKISLADAAKTLGVSKIVLQEWANFLQEEKVIDIDYKLTTTWLIEKKFTEEDIKEKKSTFESIKDNFIRKAEAAMSSITTETEGLDSIKKHFEKIKKEIAKELEKVQDEVKELESFETLKRNIDQEIINQQSQFRSTIQNAHRELLDEEKKYQALIDDIEKGKAGMQRDQADLSSLQVKEEQLQTKISEIKGIITDTQDQIDSHNSKVNYTKEHIKSLEQAADKIERAVDEKRQTIEPLLEKSKNHERKIFDVQQRLLKKVQEKKDSISQTADEGRRVIQNFKEFFEKKAQIDSLLIKIEEDKINLKTELNNLIKKAKMFDLTSSSKSTESQIKDLKKQMEEIETKKDAFKKEVGQLVNLAR